MRQVAGTDDFVAPAAPKSTEYAQESAKVRTEQDDRMLEKVTKDPETLKLLKSREYREGNPDVVAEVSRRFTDEQSQQHPSEDRGEYERALKNSSLDAEARREAIALGEAANIPAEDIAEIVRVLQANRQDKEFTREEGTAVLQKLWGPAFETNIEIAQEYLRERPALTEWLERTGMGNQPTVARAVLAIATKAGNIRSEINWLMADRKGPYWNEHDPAHKATVRKVADLHRRLYAGTAGPA